MMMHSNVFTCLRHLCGPVLSSCFYLIFLMPQAAFAEGVDSALYWSIMDDERQAGYLLGTIHSEDPRVLDFPQEFLDQLASNQVFAMEMVPDLPTLTKLTDYMQYQDGTTLESKVGAERYVKIRNMLSQYQVPADWIGKMKVWAAVVTLSVPPPETGFFMDFSLSLRAAGSGLRVVGLETLEEQLSFLENMAMEQQMALLDQALLEYDQVREVHESMVDNYLAGDLQALKTEAESQLGQLDKETKDYFIEQGIDARNRRMLESLLPLLDQSRVFVAVGALHLPGEMGLIALLRENGYRLEPVLLPFSASVQALAK
jgi:uncharacterized protein YbaP (TraB family)